METQTSPKPGAVLGKKVKPRFRRVPAAIRVTERDLEIIRQVYKHRFLTSEHILALVPGGRNALLRRLGYLFHAGYLDRPRAQLARIGNTAMVYGLGNLGADLMVQELDLPASSVDWTSKNRAAGNVFLEHTLMVANFMATVELACRSVQDVEFIPPERIVLHRPKEPNLTGKALSWRVESSQVYPGHKRKLGFSMVPDNAFGLKFSRNGKNGISYFFLEADRSTMPIKASNLARSSFYKKMIGYWESWRQRLFSENFGFKSARVLTLTISEERIQSLLKANRDLDPKGKGSGMFLFARENHFSLENPEAAFSPTWLNGRGESVSLVD